MYNSTDIRSILETHSEGNGHRGFCTRDGHYYEGYYCVDEDEDIIHFASGGPLGGWEQDFPFSAINMETLVPPLTPAAGPELPRERRVETEP